MSDDFKIKVSADLDTTEVEKKLNDLSKGKKKVKIDIDDSQLDKVTEKINKASNKKKKVTFETEMKGNGKEQVEGLSKGFDSAKKSADSFSHSFLNIAKMGAQIDVFRIIKREAQEAVQAVKQIDDAIVDLQMATNQSYNSVRQMMIGYNDMAKQLGATTTEVSSGADAWLRQGKSISETNGLIKDSMVLAKVANLESADSTKYLTAVMKGFKKSAEEVGEINDALTSIDMVSATDAGGLAEATSRVAASAELAGVELNKLLGYEAAVGEASQESMSVIGNSFKTIFQRMSDIKAGKLELVDEDGTIETLSDVELVLKNAGIQLRDSANEFRDFDDVLDDTAKKWEKLSSVQRAAVSKAFSGQRQANRFQLLMENYNKALEYTEIANKSQGTAMQKFEENYINSLEAKQKTLRASFESLAINTISRDSYSGVVEATQSLVEFLDKTNLVKGALAGLATGLAMKGFLSFTSGITKATMNMQNFQRAIDLIKMGNVGKDGIKQLATYIDGLSKSQLKAVLSSNQLSTAQRMQILQASGMSKAQASATLATMGLATAEGTATASTVSLSTAMKGLISTMLANPIFLVTTAVTAGVAVWQSYKQSVEDANNSARESAQAFNESNANLNNHIAKVQELKSALASGTLSEEESYQAKSQLLDIQNQLIDTYGEQASQIDLVNGNLEKELALMNQLAVQDANKYLNKNKDAIDRAEKEMTKERHVYLGQFSPDVKDGKELQKIIDKYKDEGLYTDDDGSGQVYIHFKGDATEAEKTLNDFMTDVRALSEETGDGYGFLGNIEQYASEELGKVNDIIEDYHDIYNTALQSDMISKGFGKDAPATVYKDYADAIEKYNEALASGDTDSITDAKNAFDEVKGAVDDVLAKYPEYQTLFDEIGNLLNESAIKAKEFGDAIGASDFKDIVSQFKDLKDVDLKSISFDDDVTAKGEDALKAVVDKAIELGIVSDDSADSVAQMVDMLVELGLTGTQSTESLSKSFERANTSIQKATSNVRSLRGILSESYDGGGLSEDSLKLFREMFGEEANSALEKTANGYHINEQALEKLQNKQSEMTKSDYLSALSEQYEALRTIDEQIAKASFMDEDISGLQAQRSGIEDQISTLKDLQLQYEAANSAYQQWQAAMSGGEEGDMYDSMFNGIEKAQDLYNKGLTGTNTFEEYTDLISNRDLSGASNEEIVAAYEVAMPKIQRYFTEGQEGAQNFLNDIQAINSEWAHMNEDGSWDINFGEGNDQAIADAIGIDVEAVQAIMRKLSDYGFEIELDQPVASIESLKNSAQSAKEALAGMNENTLSDINLDSSSFGEVTGNIDKVKEYIETLNESDIEPDVKTERLEYANDILEYLVGKQDELSSKEIELKVNADELESKIETAKSALDEFKNDDGVVDLSVEGAQEAVDNLQVLLYQKEQLNAPAVMSVDVSGVEGELGSALTKIQEYQSAVQQLNAQNELKAQGVDIDTSSAEAKVSSLAAEIQGINPEITAKLGVDTTSLTTIQSSVAGITPEILVKAGVDASLVTGYTPADKSSTVKFKVDSSAVDTWTAPSKSGKVTYTAIWDIGNPPAKTQYVNVVETKRAAGTMITPARAHGTLSAFANGRVALPKNERALVNEVGQESRITNDGTWELLPPGIHIENLKKGEIILNAEQTKDLINHGKAKGTGLMKAYSRGTGKFNVGSSGSAAWSGSNSNSTSSSNNSSSNTSDQTKEFNEKIDEIEILLDRMEKSFERLTDSIETYSYDLSKQSEVSTQAMNQIRTNLGTLQQAYNRYIQEANSVGLDESWKNKIQNGAINIEEITDKNLKEKIDEFQKWFNKATDVQDKIAEMQKELLDLAVEKLDNIEKYFENRTDYNDNFGYLTPITLLQESLDKFTKELEKQVNDGVIKEGSNEWYESMESISKMQEKILEATLKKYQDIIDNLSRISDTLDNSIELKEARDEPILESDYSKQIDLNNKSIQEKYNKRQQLLKQQAIYDVGSAKYDEIAEEIADIDDDIYGLLTDIEELKDKIWEVRWQPFFDGQEALKDLIDETDTFRDLLDSDAFVGKNGGLTADGITNIALISSAMNEQKQSIKNYSTALEKLQEDYDKGNISAKEFKETSKEFMDEIASGVSNVEKYKDEIVSLYEEMLEKENDVVQKSIQKHEKLLDIRKKNDSYSRNVKKQVKDINLVQAQLAALSGTNNQEALKQKKLLEAQLKEMQDELSQTQKDREYDIRQSGFDNLSEDLNSALEDTLDAVKYNSSKQEEVISEMLNNIVGMYGTAYDKINQIIGNTGFKPSDDFQQNIGNLGTQTGAENQVQDSNTIAPNYKPDDFASGTNTGQIQSGSSQSNNDKIESEIEKEPNTTNRPVAQLTLKPTSISIQEGQSKNISVNIRPTDAANKMLNWKSSNDSVATVSNGSVKALKAGSCKITASTTDGSGISATVGVTVTAKPKPKPKPPAPKPSSGDGVIRVGDKVTFTGNYYSDSWGGTPLGNLYAGVPGGVVVDAYSGAEYGGGSNFHGGYAIHIKSADGRYGDLGWVMPSQISGYAKGTRGIKKDLEFAKINELGNELVIRRGGNDYTALTYGSAVVPHDLSDKLFTLAKHTDQIINASVGANGGNRNVEVNNHYDSVITVNGNVDKDVMPRLERDMDKLCQQISKRLYKDAGLMGIQKKL